MGRKIATLHYTSDEILHCDWIDQLITHANGWGIDGWKIVGVKVKPNTKGGRTFKYTLATTDEEYQGPAEGDDPVGDDIPEEIVRAMPKDRIEPKPMGGGLFLPPSGLKLPGGIIK